MNTQMTRRQALKLVGAVIVAGGLPGCVAPVVRISITVGSRVFQLARPFFRIVVQRGQLAVKWLSDKVADKLGDKIVQAILIAFARTPVSEADYEKLRSGAALEVITSDRETFQVPFETK